MGEPAGKDKSWLDKAEDWVSDSLDEQRKTIPESDKWALLKHDIDVGLTKGLYGGVKGLVSGVIDVVTWAVKMQYDQETKQKTGDAVWNFLVFLAKEQGIQLFGNPQQRGDQIERAAVFTKKVWDSSKKAVTEAWAEAEATPGKRSELVSKWVSRGVFEIAALFIGPGEVKAALKGAEVAGDVEKLAEVGTLLEKGTQPCKDVAKAAEEAAALAKAEAADEAVAAARAAEATKSAIAEAAKKVGMKAEHVEALVADCAEKDRVAIYRKSNPESIKYQDQLSARAKPHDVEVLKTAKQGQENAGLVVHPPRPVAEAEAAEISKLENEGWTFDTKDRLRDPEGYVVHGDYDMQGIYKRVGTDTKGKPIYEMVDTNSDSSYFLEEHNEMITPERDMHKHGANDNYKKIGPNGEKMGRQPGADETFLVVDKNGPKVLESTAELQKYYEANNIPWPYQNYK